MLQWKNLCQVLKSTRIPILRQVGLWPEELLAICRELGITEDKVNIILRTTEEGTDEKTGV